MGTLFGDPWRMRWVSFFGFPILAISIGSMAGCHSTPPAPAAVSPKMTFTPGATTGDFYAVNASNGKQI